MWKAKLSAPHIDVPGGIVAAAKVLNVESEEARNELIQEAMVTAQLSGHAHVVGLLGVVTAGNPAMLLVTFCEHGSLLDQLRKRASRQDTFSVTAKLRYGVQISLGMEYLAQRHVVHRDLAARNVLLDVEWQAQVADFGLSRETNDDDDDRDYYRSSKGGAIPFRWTAPEAMQDLRFSQSSDVWSFGIVLVELFQDGQQPYAFLPQFQNVHFFLEKGERIRQQDLPGCTDNVYAIMYRCWNHDPAARPTFAALVTELQDVLAEAHTSTDHGAPSATQRIPAAASSADPGVFTTAEPSSCSGGAGNTVAAEGSPQGTGHGATSSAPTPFIGYGATYKQFNVSHTSQQFMPCSVGQGQDSDDLIKQNDAADYNERNNAGPQRVLASLANSNEYARTSSADIPTPSHEYSRLHRPFGSIPHCISASADDQRLEQHLVSKGRGGGSRDARFEGPQPGEAVGAESRRLVDAYEYEHVAACRDEIPIQIYEQVQHGHSGRVQGSQLYEFTDVTDGVGAPQPVTAIEGFGTSGNTAALLTCDSSQNEQVVTPELDANVPQAEDVADDVPDCSSSESMERLRVRPANNCSLPADQHVVVRNRLYDSADVLRASCNAAATAGSSVEQQSVAPTALTRSFQLQDGQPLLLNDDENQLVGLPRSASPALVDLEHDDPSVLPLRQTSL